MTRIQGSGNADNVQHNHGTHHAHGNDPLSNVNAADLGLHAGFNSDGSPRLAAFPTGHSHTQGTEQRKLSPEARAAMLRNITQNLSTPEQIANAADSADEGLESTANRAVAFASTLADFTSV